MPQRINTKDVFRQISPNGSPQAHKVPKNMKVQYLDFIYSTPEQPVVMNLTATGGAVASSISIQNDADFIVYGLSMYVNDPNNNTDPQYAGDPTIRHYAGYPVDENAVLISLTDTSGGGGAWNQPNPISLGHLKGSGIQNYYDLPYPRYEVANTVININFTTTLITTAITTSLNIYFALHGKKKFIVNA